MYELTPREKRSKAIFGTKDAIDVFGAMLKYCVEPPPSFTVQDVKKEFLDQDTINYASIHRNLAKLEGVGAIEQVAEQRPPSFRCIPNNLFWDKLIRPIVDEEINRSLEA